MKHIIYNINYYGKIFLIKILRRLHVTGCMLQDRGFSLIGVLVSVFVAAVGITAIFSLSIMSLKTSDVGRMRLVASGLAQEGIEIVRDVRVANLNWEDWEWYATTTPVTHPVGSSQEYCLEYNSTSLFSCPFPEIPLKLDQANMLYQYSVGSDTSFYRKITLTRESNDEVKVFVEVKWQLGRTGDWHYLIAEDRLWNWR